MSPVEMAKSLALMSTPGQLYMLSQGTHPNQQWYSHIQEDGPLRGSLKQAGDTVKPTVEMTSPYKLYASMYLPYKAIVSGSQSDFDRYLQFQYRQGVEPHAASRW